MVDQGKDESNVGIGFAGEDEDAYVEKRVRFAEDDFVTTHEEQDLKRGLSQRHVGLIAIAGAIVSGIRSIGLLLPNDADDCPFGRALAYSSVSEAQFRRLGPWAHYSPIV